MLSILVIIFFIIVIFILSFYLKKNYLSRDWDKHRCDYILLSGYLTPDKNVSSSQYTIDNMKYCIKQDIYKNRGIIPQMKHKYNKLKYIIDYITKQIGLYHNKLEKETENIQDEHKNEIYNKINYLTYKHRQLTKINNKINEKIIPISERLSKGVDYYKIYEKEKEMNKIYKDPNYMNNYMV
tara:strand:- start:29 stop:574 length:546 start_codon:yes stop_codon:yes gene_type:complete